MKMLYDVAHFNRSIKQRTSILHHKTIGEFLDEQHYGSLFAENYLLPMVAAIWSMGLDDVRSFPLQFFARFFENHGLLNIVDRPQWYSIIGGSSSYVEPLIEPFKDSINLSTPVQRLARNEDGITVSFNGTEQQFDDVIVACHGDEALRLLGEPSGLEQQVLGSFRFTDNDVVLHTDESLLPREKKAWASWNYLTNNSTSQATLTYNMNILQRLEKKHTYLVTLNQEIAEDKVLARFNYAHPFYDNSVIEAQKDWHRISDVDHIHYCGAYWFNGFHEDGVKSALRVCESLGVQP
jgi:predicted NAD/FAD-binding protein